jgi:hypothetical protein
VPLVYYGFTPDIYQISSHAYIHYKDSAATRSSCCDEPSDTGDPAPSRGFGVPSGECIIACGDCIPACGECILVCGDCILACGDCGGCGG